MAASGYELIIRAAEFGLGCARDAEQRYVKELETRAATPLVDGLRMLSFNRTMIAIGVVQSFEGYVQLKKGWANPVKKIDELLRAEGRSDLADSYSCYYEAINALKHGDGRSYQALRKKLGTLPFAVKASKRDFFVEGDVSEVAQLVQADEDFVRECVAVLEAIIPYVRKAEP